MQQFARRPFSLLAALLALFLGASIACAQNAGAAPEIDLATAPVALVMISDPGCPYCARWEREVAPGYEASEDGKIAHLLGVAAGRLVATGDRVLLFDVRDGRLVHAWPDAGGREGFGRGLL
ncbi:MAG: hypothetical protein J0J14_12080, partial [Hyphomicrobium sp.]|nr:hypothetical protein [Hyphomicrobium sp.]